MLVKYSKLYLSCYSCLSKYRMYEVIQITQLLIIPYPTNQVNNQAVASNLPYGVDAPPSNVMHHQKNNLYRAVSQVRIRSVRKHDKQRIKVVFIAGV